MPKLASFRAKKPPAGAGEAAAREGDASTNILHVDMDAFFVSVELLNRPDLRGKPVVVGGQPDQRGVVSAASYEARRYGIQSAMPLRTAGRLCPHAVFLEGHHELYSLWSDRIAVILSRYSPRVEMASVDEAYLDLTGTERLLGHPLAAAHRLRREIWDKTKLPSSIGVARTRLVAKVASDQSKPAGLLWIPAGSEAGFLARLKVRKIPGIGAVTEETLRGLGVETVAQLALIPREQLEKVFGEWGSGLYRKARGEDTYHFLEDAEAKSISHHHTFSEDVTDAAPIEATLSHLCQKACKRLRDAGLFAGTITLVLRYENFETITRARTVPSPTNLDQDVLRVARELVAKHRNKRRRVRLVGISLTSFSHGEGQMDLLDPARREKLEKLARASDRLRERFGFDKVQLGGSVRPPPEEN
ncbi:MAG TPA: DNA polymerase IV [Candidatus Acidoferrales bacterium]|nr:DNA polymerase IV [Candidatus Acidoferrales bacterium]